MICEAGDSRRIWNPYGKRHAYAEELSPTMGIRISQYHYGSQNIQSIPDSQPLIVSKVKIILSESGKTILSPGGCHQITNEVG